MRRLRGERRVRRGVLDLVGRQVPAAPGQFHRERAALAEPALHLHRAAMQVGQLRDQRQADAGAFDAAAVRALDAVEALEHVRQRLLRDAHAAVGHLQPDAARRGPQPHHHPAGQRVLDRVRHQVEDDLLPQAAVDVHGLRQRLAHDLHRQPGAGGGRLEEGGQPGGVGGQVERAEAGPHAPAFEARELQQRVHHPLQAMAVALGQPQRVARRPAHARALQQVAQRPEHQRQRRAQLVAHVGEEQHLGAVQLGQRAGALALDLEAARVGDGAGDPLRRQSEVVEVVAVQRPARIQPGDHEAARGARRRRPSAAARSRPAPAPARGRRAPRRARPRRSPPSARAARPLPQTARGLPWPACRSPAAPAAGRRCRRARPAGPCRRPAGTAARRAGRAHCRPVPRPRSRRPRAGCASPAPLRPAPPGSSGGARPARARSRRCRRRRRRRPRPSSSKQGL